MSERLVIVDRETPVLLPVDMRQCASGDELVHFVIQAVETMKLPSLVIYCYANGVRRCWRRYAGRGARRNQPRIGRYRRPGYQTRRPQDSQQIDLTDPHSALMRKSRRDGWEQACNAQAVVDVGDSRLILGTVQLALADEGYVNAEQIEAVGSPVDLYVAITSEVTPQRRYDYRPPKESHPKKVTDPRLVAMREKVTNEEGRWIYSRRACTGEPTFGTIKAVLGLRQFLMRGLERVRIEWDLACLAYNATRIWKLKKA